MFTTPKKGTTRFRPHPYQSPGVSGFRVHEPQTVSPRSSPGGSSHTSPSPFASRFKTPSTTPRKRYYVDGDRPFTSPIKVECGGIHRNGIRHTHSQTHRRHHRAPISPTRPSSLPTNLGSNPTFISISQETFDMAQRSRLPLSHDDCIFVAEMQRLDNAHDFANALAEAREAANRGVEAAPAMNAKINARSRAYDVEEQALEEKFRTSQLDSHTKPVHTAKAKGSKQRANEERFAKQQAAADRERRVQEQREEDRKLYQEHLADLKRQRVEREQHEMETHADAQPPIPLSTDLPPPEESMQTETNHEEIQRRLRDEEERHQLAAERRALESARLRFEAEKEAELRRAREEEVRRQQARLEEERKRVEEERIRFEEERMQTEYARMRLEEQQMRTAQQEEDFRRAKQEAAHARLAAERQAQEEARQRAARILAEQQARIQAEQEAFARAQAEARYLAEQREARAFAEQAAHMAEMARLEEEMRARIAQATEAERASEAEFYANRERSRLYEQHLHEQFLHEERQRQEYQQQQYYQQQQQQHFTDYSEFQSHQEDIPMRERSYVDMDASMHSITDDTPYADAPPSYSSSPPRFSSPPPPPPSPSPPLPLTDTDRFDLYDKKWKAIQSDVPFLTFAQVPWPILHDVETLEDITPNRVREFICHPNRPGFLRKSIKYRVNPEILRYHPDKFGKILPKVSQEQEPIIKAAMEEVARILVLLRDTK